jgi:quercetin dioxygenase-like cupin family protein
MTDKPDQPPIHASADTMAWDTSPSYPEALQRVVRWKMLAGGNLFGGAVGIPQKDAMMGVLDLDAGGYYPAHAHPAPEFYYVISGTAEWTVGDETFTATPGMAIYHAPNVPHRMVNYGPEPLHTLWFWWAPDGDTEVFNGKITLLEDMPAPPSGEG